MSNDFVNNNTKCFSTGKTRYATPGDAKEAMLKIKSIGANRFYQNGKRINRRAGKPAQARFYRCVHCSGFHLTSHKGKLVQKTINKIFEQRVKDTQGLVVDPSEVDNWKANSLPFPENKI